MLSASIMLASLECAIPVFIQLPWMVFGENALLSGSTLCWRFRVPSWFSKIADLKDWSSNYRPDSTLNIPNAPPSSGCNQAPVLGGKKFNQTPLEVSFSTKLASMSPGAKLSNCGGLNSSGREYSTTQNFGDAIRFQTERKFSGVGFSREIPSFY